MYVKYPGFYLNAASNVDSRILYSTWMKIIVGSDKKSETCVEAFFLMK